MVASTLKVHVLGYFINGEKLSSKVTTAAVAFGVFSVLTFVSYCTAHPCWLIRPICILMHGPPMLVDKTIFGLVIYNHTNFYQFEETSSYWSKEYQFFSAFHWSTSDTPQASQCLTVQ